MFDQLDVSDLVSLASEQPLLAGDDEEGLVRRVRAGDEVAVEELVRGNLRIAIDEAIRARGLGLPQSDLVRLGVRALFEAVRSHDPAEHGPFSSHARSVVRKVMIRRVSIS